MSDRSDRIGKHPRGCHSASPESRLAEPKTRGKGGAVYPSTLVVALGRLCDHKSRMIVYTPFPPVVRGRLPPSTRGLSEWHPRGCTL